ncbi:hypothetical protein C8R45DRAFT_102888 [Mycena sanguinolenta]|nr:hypothetical protein C8R45DRAFT_102888 [Mycena sanguinolenta]
MLPWGQVPQRCKIGYLRESVRRHWSLNTMAILMKSSITGSRGNYYKWAPGAPNTRGKVVHNAAALILLARPPVSSLLRRPCPPLGDRARSALHPAARNTLLVRCSLPPPEPQRLLGVLNLVNACRPRFSGPLDTLQQCSNFNFNWSFSPALSRFLDLLSNTRIHRLALVAFCFRVNFATDILLNGEVVPGLGSPFLRVRTVRMP